MPESVLALVFTIAFFALLLGWVPLLDLLFSLPRRFQSAKRRLTHTAPADR